MFGEASKSENPFKDKISLIRTRISQVKFSDGGNQNSIAAVELVGQLTTLLEEAGAKIAALEDKVYRLTNSKDNE